MLINYFFVGLAFALMELVLVYNWPWLKRLIERNPIIEMVFSLALSAGVAWSMSIPAGVTIAIANVFSTIITLGVYHYRVVERYRAAKHFVVNTKTQVKNTLNEFSAVVHVIWVVVMFIPLTLKRALKALNDLLVWVNRRKNSVI